MHMWPIREPQLSSPRPQRPPPGPHFPVPPPPRPNIGNGTKIGDAPRPALVPPILHLDKRGTKKKDSRILPYLKTKKSRWWHWKRNDDYSISSGSSTSLYSI